MKRFALFALFLASLLAPRVSRADLQFMFAQPVVTAQQNSIFDLVARVFNTGDPADPNAPTYNVDHYIFTVTPDALALPDDLADDPTPFVTNFQRVFAPGDDSGAQTFTTFSVGPHATPGTYNVAFELQDAANIGLAQQSFTLNIAAVPEPALVVTFPVLLTLGGIALRRRSAPHVV